MHHHRDMHSLQSYMHMHYNAVAIFEHILFCSHIPYNKAAPIPGICINIGPIPAIFMVSESVKHVIRAQILCFVHY